MWANCFAQNAFNEDIIYMNYFLTQTLTTPQLNVQANLHVYILFSKLLNLKQYKNE